MFPFSCQRINPTVESQLCCNFQGATWPKYMRQDERILYRCDRRLGRDKSCFSEYGISRYGADSGVGTASNGLWVRSRIHNLGFQSPIPQVVRIESDAEKIAGKESEFGRSHSDQTNDDAICSGNDPALPQLLPDEDRRKDC